MTILLLIQNKRTLKSRVLLFIILFIDYRLGNSSIKSGVPLKPWPWNCC